MKNRSVYVNLILLALLVLLDVGMISRCQMTAKLNRILGEKAMDIFRAMEADPGTMEQFREWAKEEKNCSEYDFLCARLLTGENDPDSLKWYISRLKEYRSTEYQEYLGYLEAVWKDLKYFPVPESLSNPEAYVSFGNSWMNLRTFGGSRGHEGCDIMASLNERGRYPVVSMTDGVVEKIGWLTQGGYRIGIRAAHGGYFYYAHLSDYAREFEPGDTVMAGELLGFMGDSGYSTKEGTIGNFDVHLHLGIYVNGSGYKEISINSFWPLKYLETHKLAYQYY